MGVLIDNQSSRLKIPVNRIEQTAQAILDALDFPDGELSILILDDPQITRLNARYLNRSGPTNVIAFPMQEGRFSTVSPHLLGDVVISDETAEREGLSAGIDPERRFFELLIHGVLHLVGYDHEAGPEAARKMTEKERDLVQAVDLD
ncbi:MAG: rRNA maturation RNase YbeY [Deltaproteobacteria bacterium]|nr:rRNA maturation RNase YbeY [Deltaproteobacteria bacterium]